MSGSLESDLAELVGDQVVGNLGVGTSITTESILSTLTLKKAAQVSRTTLPFGKYSAALLRLLVAAALCGAFGQNGASCVLAYNLILMNLCGNYCASTAMEYDTALRRMIAATDFGAQDIRAKLMVTDERLV